MAEVKTFITPREIVWGRGSLAHLEKISGKRALIITDKVMVNLGIVAKAEQYLKKGGLEVDVFDGSEPNPPITNVMEAVEKHKGFDPDVIVGLGGGSAIDVSKGFRIFFEHPQLTFEGVRYFGGPPKTPILPFKKTISVAISSTSGTGSEVSWAGAITDPTINVKCIVGSPLLIPTIAIADPDVSDSMPKVLQADTGLDALTHAIEAYISLLGSDFTRTFAFQSTILLMKYLGAAYQGDKDAKEHVHYGALLAGCSFSNSGLGIDHVVATQVGGKFHFTHGRACAVVLPYSIKFNGKAAGEHYTELARATGYSGNDPSGAVDYLVQRVIEIQKQMEMPVTYRDAGIPEEAYLAELQDMLDKSPSHPGTISNPRKYTVEELKLLYDASYYGNYDLI